MNLSISSFNVAQEICVNEYTILKDVVKTVDVREPVNHVFCCDISGSMWDSN